MFFRILTPLCDNMLSQFCFFLIYATASYESLQELATGLRVCQEAEK